MAKMIRATISRNTDDPICLRASIGGDEDVGYYLTFRGDPAKVVQMLRVVTGIAEQALPAKQYADKRGRPQG